MAWTIEREHDHVVVVSMNTNKITALDCDHRFASESAPQFSLNEAPIGIPMRKRRAAANADRCR
jgi:hypothetical protein